MALCGCWMKCLPMPSFRLHGPRQAWRPCLRVARGCLMRSAKRAWPNRRHHESSGPSSYRTLSEISTSIRRPVAGPLWSARAAAQRAAARGAEPPGPGHPVGCALLSDGPQASFEPARSLGQWPAGGLLGTARAQTRRAALRQGLGEVASRSPAVAALAAGGERAPARRAGRELVRQPDAGKPEHPPVAGATTPRTSSASCWPGWSRPSRARPGSCRPDFLTTWRTPCSTASARRPDACRSSRQLDGHGRATMEPGTRTNP